MFSRRVLATLLTAAVLQFTAVSFVFAADHYVPSPECATIQEAINHSVSGDRINVFPGVYSESLNILGKRLTIQSTTGELDCSILSAYVDFKGGLGLTGFALGNAFLDTNPDDYDGSGAVGWFTKCEFSGSGIFAILAYLPSVDRCAFLNNAAIYVDSNDEVVVTNSSFSGTGKAIEAFFGTITVVNSTFRGGCRLVSCARYGTYISNCSFENGSGVTFDNTGDSWLEIDQCKFTGPGQTAIVAIGYDYGSMTINRCTVSGYQNGLAMDGGEVSNCLFVGNRIGVFFQGYVGYLDSSTVSGNRYGVVVTDDGSTLSMDSTIVYGNTEWDLSGASEYWTDHCLVGKWDTWLWWYAPQPIVTSDPRFVQPASPGPDGIFGSPDDDLGDLRLLPMSPGINKGNGWRPGTDLAGAPRTYGAKVDIGAYELQGGSLNLAGVFPESFLVGKTGVFKVYGTGLAKGCVVWINGVAHATTFTSEFVVSTRATSADTAVAGVFDLSVANPGGAVSNVVPFIVANPKPSVTSLNPTSILHGSADFPLVLAGARFVPGSVVYWNGSPRPTVFNSAGQLTASISAADVAAMGVASLTVVNPGPGGGVSNVKTFRIK